MNLEKHKRAIEAFGRSPLLDETGWRDPEPLPHTTLTCIDDEGREWRLTYMKDYPIKAWEKL
jgi:hypothetical protein